MPPGRPIISGIDTLTEKLSGFVDSFLNPLLVHIPSFIKDTTDFLRTLNTIDTLPNDALLVTMDVTSLYTNIPHNKGILACKNFIEKHTSDLDFANDMATLIEFILKNNYFSFNNNFYLQSQGTAMGTKMAPAYANIFMDKIESEMLQNFPFKPSHYMRYIDDIFFIWPHGHSTLKDFHHFVNSFHHSIKFTFEISTSEIPFLDVLVKLRSNSISTSVFYKPTDNHQYLHFSSSHPLSLKKSIVFSQCLRLKRICSDPIDYKDSISRLTGFFLSNGYPLLTIKSGIAKADPYKREDLLRYKEKSGGDRIPLVFDHHPNIRNLAHTLKTDFASLQEDSNLSELFSEPPVLALRQPPNLKQILTSSKLPKTHTPPLGNTKCNTVVVKFAIILIPAIRSKYLAVIWFFTPLILIATLLTLFILSSVLIVRLEITWGKLVPVSALDLIIIRKASEIIFPAFLLLNISIYPTIPLKTWNFALLDTISPLLNIEKMQK